METIREQFGLVPDSDSNPSRFTVWCNRMMEKSVAALDVADVTKMIRQDILRDVAVERAAGMLERDPFAGEMWRGHLLATLAWLASEAALREMAGERLRGCIRGMACDAADGSREDGDAYRSNLTFLKEALAVPRAEQVTIRERHALEPDAGSPASGLVVWYNRMIEKPVDSLNAADAMRMIRQNILPDIALGAAIRIFARNPFAGELWDGQLLETLASISPEAFRDGDRVMLLAVLRRVEGREAGYEWMDEADHDAFVAHLRMLGRSLAPV